jgi:hypothetical protein
MVALCRRAGVPARLVGGLILAGGTKRTTHQWVEAYIDNVWVAFCPLNGYFATKPASYLACYRGDHAYFTHTTDINFDYSFSVARKLVPRHEDFGGHKALDIVNVWNAFENAGIPLHALSVVLVIPIGALVTIIFRNVIGVQTFGTFLPALIAYAFLRTGILWGGGIFVTIIVLGAGLDWVLSRLRLLHTPRLTLLMVFSVVALLTLGMLGIVIGNDHVAHSFFFPLAILSITVERFFVIAQERGTRHSLSILMFTMIVAAFCYMVMSSVFLQVMVVVLPETYLLIVACVLYLGHWTGLRVSEFVRFRGLVFGEEPRVAEGTKG